MKFSYETIKKLIPDISLSAQELADILTMHAFETVIDREYKIDPAITVVKILKIDPHPNADKLRIATVTDGSPPTGRETSVVCGAPNIEVGQIVPYAPPGAIVYDEHRELFAIKEAVIRGEKSPGMLNSVRELGISDNHDGILVLPENIPLGSRIADYITSDSILAVDVLPDRARDCVSHVALAHEVAALTKNEISEIEKPLLFDLTAQISGLMPFTAERGDASAPRTIELDPDRPSKIAGVRISHEEVRDILQRLGFAISPTWAVTPPPERLDVTGEHDLVDEVVRVHGLDSIPPTTQKFPAPLPVSQSVYWTGLLRRTLSDAGFTETYSYSFEDERFAKMLNGERHPHVELSNPMAPELKMLRYSMLPGLIGAMIKSRDEIHRSKKNNERALFEIGRVYHIGDGGTVPGVIERPVVAGIAIGDENTLQITIDRVCELLRIERLTVLPLTKGEAEGTYKSFAKYNLLKYADEFFGIGYIFSDELLKKMKYRMPVIAFEISINALLKHAPDVEIPVRTLDEIRNVKESSAQFIELPKYPSVFRDISLLVSPAVTVEQIQQSIEHIGKELIVDVDLFDKYDPQPFDPPAGGLRAKPLKGFAFHIEYRSSEKTLTDTEITEIHNKIEHVLKEEFAAEIR